MVCIFFMEDDEVVCSFVKWVFEFDGYNVEMVMDGGEVVEILVCEIGDFELFLLDIKMFVMDGIVLVLYIVWDYLELLILLMIGFVD